MLVFTFTKPLARGWFLTGPPQKKERQHKAIGPFTRYLKKILSVVYKHKEYELFLVGVFFACVLSLGCL
jgi:hypothetical protein